MKQLASCIFGILLACQANAKPVVYGPQSTTICIGKSATLIRSKIQVADWYINGKTSSLSTFSYKGRFSTLVADFATADVVATCRVKGEEVYTIQWMLAFNDPNNYSVRYSVNCVPCPVRTPTHPGIPGLG